LEGAGREAGVEEDGEEEERRRREEVEGTVQERLLVTNQVLVTTQTAAIRKRNQTTLGLKEDVFRFEPTVFAPRLAGVVKNIDIESILLPRAGPSHTLPASVPLLCLHTDEGLENNTEDLLEELRSRQLEYDIGHKEEEQEAEQEEEQEEQEEQEEEEEEEGEEDEDEEDEDEEDEEEEDEEAEEGEEGEGGDGGG
jgi:hypothetical protein